MSDLEHFYAPMLPVASVLGCAAFDLAEALQHEAQGLYISPTAIGEQAGRLVQEALKLVDEEGFKPSHVRFYLRDRGFTFRHSIFLYTPRERET